MEAHKKIFDVADNFPLGDHLRMGQVVDVEIQNHHHDRFLTRLVGCKDGHYLVLEQPDSKKYGHIQSELNDQHILVIRTIFERTSGEAAAFTSSLMSKISYPSRLFFIEFPRQIESRELRRESRQQTHMPARIFHSENASDERKIAGHIINISDGGCCFECEVQDRVKGIKQERVYIELLDAEGRQTRVALAEVRSQRKVKNCISIGLAFVN